MSIFENRIKVTSQTLGVLLSQPILEERVSEMGGLDDCPVFIDINDLNSFANSSLAITLSPEYLWLFP